MAITWKEAETRLAQAAAILNDEREISAAGFSSEADDVSGSAGCDYQAPSGAVNGGYHVGIDLGTADVVLMVLDDSGTPVAAFLKWSEVVRDGVVVDFVGAVDIVRELVAKAKKRLGIEITAAATSFPPGTDERLSTNILETAGLDVLRVLDEPSCVATLLELDKAAVVDIGGGTTGTAIVQKGVVTFSDDEPTGGKHITLSVAGHYNITTDEAEERKRQHDRYNLMPIARPTIERICDIVSSHIAGHDVETLILSGGTCCLPGIEGVFKKELGLAVRLPTQPLLLTPLSIASLSL